MTGVPALFTRHRGLARSIADGYFWAGAERQDILQEAEIGLWIAARNWDPDGRASFKSFASLVIRRRLSTLVRAALADIRGPLDGAARVATSEEGDTCDLVDLLPGPHDTERVVVGRDTLARVTAALEQLTPLERLAVARAANGERYAGDKSIDNALARARVKLRKAAA